MRCAKGFIWVVNIHDIKPDPATPAAGSSPATGMGLPDRIDIIKSYKNAVSPLPISFTSSPLNLMPIP